LITELPYTEQVCVVAGSRAGRLLTDALELTGVAKTICERERARVWRRKVDNFMVADFLSRTQIQRERGGVTELG
jgi:hypothetical protein